MITGEFCLTQTETCWSHTALKTGLALKWKWGTFYIFVISRFTLFYYSNTDAKGKGKTEIKIDTMGGEVKKLVVNDEFNMEELEQDDLKLAIQTK